MPAYTSHPLCTCLWGTCQNTWYTVNHQTLLGSDWEPETCRMPGFINLPFTNFKSARGKSILPAVLIILRVENSFFVFFWSDMLLPLLLTVAVFTTQPTVITSLWKNPQQSHLHHQLIAVCFLISQMYRLFLSPPKRKWSNQNTTLFTLSVHTV